MLLGSASAASAHLSGFLGRGDRTATALVPCNGDWHLLVVEGGELRYTVVVGIHEAELGDCICDHEQELLGAFDDIFRARSLDGWSYVEQLEGVETELLAEVQQRCPAAGGDDDDSAAPTGYAWLELDYEFRSEEVPLVGIMQRRPGCSCSLPRDRRDR